MEVTKGRLLPAPEWNPEEAALVALCVVRKVLTDEIYSQYGRKTSIYLNRGRKESEGNVDISIVRAGRYQMVIIRMTQRQNLEGTA